MTDPTARTGAEPATVGIIVNPIAGKDIRRLSSGASHTPDTTKMGIVRRVIAGAAEAGATRIVLADDPHRLARRAAERLPLPPGVEIELLSDHVSGSRHDTVAAARSFAEMGAGAVVALGGDGTCRDVATGWPDAPLIAISTGTNNVYPSPVDGTSAGVAAGLIASGAIAVERVAEPTKRIVVHVEVDGAREQADDIALVDVALIDAQFVGARAVKEPGSIRAVVAAIGHPASTGLSSIAGRTHPVRRDVKGGVFIRLGEAREPGRHVRVPLTPGAFDTVHVAEVRPITDGEPVVLHGPGVLAFDGERDLPIDAATTVTLSIERSGPRLIDVVATIALAADARAFDTERPPTASEPPEDHDDAH